MKTMENTEDVSLPPAQLAGWGRKIGGDEAHVSEKSHFRTAKTLAKSCAGRKIPETTRKTQFDVMNHKSNGKSRPNRSVLGNPQSSLVIFTLAIRDVVDIHIETAEKMQRGFSLGVRPN